MGGPGSGAKPVFERRIRVALTKEQLRQIEREKVLTGKGVADVVRAALDMYLERHEPVG